MLYSILKVIINIIVRILFRFRIHGNNELLEDKGYILVANHSSILDPIFIALAINRQIHFIAKAELFENWFLNKLFRNLNAFPIEREGKDLKALKKAVRLVRDNKVLGIFMEGTRVKEYNPENAKSGPILISKMSRSDIIPIQIKTDYKLFSKVDIIIKEPLDYKVLLEEKDYNKKAREVLDIIYNR